MGEPLSLAALSIQGVPLFDEILGPLKDIRVRTYQDRKQAYVLAKGICKLYLHALTALERDQVLEFEGLVSDTACQIRAIFLAHVWRQKVQMQPEIAQLLQRCKDLSALLSEKATKMEVKSRKPSIVLPEMDLQTFLAQKKVACQISLPLLQLGRLHMLKLIKVFRKKEYDCLDCKKAVSGFQEQTDVNKLVSLLGKVPLERLQTLVDFSKSCISRFGAEFLRQQAARFCDPLVQLMISPQNAKVINGREELACFYSLKAVMQIALAQKVSIVLKSKRSEHLVEKAPDEPCDAFICYRPTPQGYVPAPVPAQDELVLVIEGMRSGAQTRPESTQDYVARLVLLDLKQLCDLNAAQHKQYTQTGSIDEVPLLQLAAQAQEKARLKELEQLAISVGCAMQNQTLFCISHIFCDRLGNSGGVNHDK